MRKFKPELGWYTRTPEMVVGSREWFRYKADKLLKSAQPDENRVWDLSDSCLIWTPEVAELYGELQKSHEYGAEVTNKETLVYQQYAEQIIASLPEEFDFIDLGPGTERKEKYFFGAIKNQKKEVRYVPVDINEEMLVGAHEHALGEGLDSLPVHSSFEALPEILKADRWRFVSLGQTFSNYSWEDGKELLKSVMKGKGAGFITMQLRERSDMEKIRRAYESETERAILKIKLELFGFDRDQEMFATDEVGIYSTVSNPSEELRSKGFREGDTIKLLRSHRPTLEELKAELGCDFDYQIYDNGGEFVGALVRPLDERV